MGDFPATDWHTYDVPAIAAMLTDTNERSWDQVNAWRTTAQTLDTHQAALGKAIAQLSQTWSPQTSPAAAEYLGYAASLRNSIAVTAQAAHANATALANALSALDQARDRINALHSTWQTLTGPPARGGTVISGWEAASASASEPETIGPAKATLNARAADIMFETEQIIFDNTRRFQLPDVLAVLRPGPFESTHPVATSQPPDDGSPSSNTLDGSGSGRIGPEGQPIETPKNGGPLDGSAPQPDTARSGTWVVGVDAPSRDPGVDLEAGLGVERPGTAMPIQVGGHTALGLPTGDPPFAPGATPSTSAAASSTDSSQLTGASAIADQGAGGAPAVETFGPMAPGFGAVPHGTTGRSRNRGIGKTHVPIDQSEVVAGLILPTIEPALHDPGPHVIGGDH